MLEFDADSLRVSFDLDGNMSLSLSVGKNNAASVKTAYDELKGKKLAVTIKTWRNKRSLDANAFMWSLCEKIAQVIRSTKEEVYRGHVKEYGAYMCGSFADSDIPSLERSWAANGTAWFLELVDTPLPGYRDVRLYMGSSVYDTAQMSHLLDGVIASAEGLGIPTLTDEMLQKMKATWKGAKNAV